jgi:ligand-binding sensor domain-containing protein
MSFDAETWRTFTAENSGFPSRYPMKIVAGEQNTLWVATRSSAGCPGGLARYENGQWVSYTPENSGLPYPDIYDISIDSHGNLWLATHEYQAFGTYVQSALVKFDGNVAWEIISHNRNAIITALGHTGDDRLWIATSSNPALSPMTYDISVLEDGKQIRLSTLDHRFPLPYTFNIIVDTTGRTWLATTIGLLTVKPFPLISQ